MDRPPEPGRGATAAQIKNDIDSGLTGDKVGGFDPAAAPLGVDEEAGGAPYDPHLLQATREQESAGRPADARPNGATPELAPNGSMSRRMPFFVAGLIGVVGALVFAAVLLAVL